MAPEPAEGAALRRRRAPQYLQTRTVGMGGSHAVDLRAVAPKGKGFKDEFRRDVRTNSEMVQVWFLKNDSRKPLLLTCCIISGAHRHPKAVTHRNDYHRSRCSSDSLQVHAQRCESTGAGGLPHRGQGPASLQHEGARPRRLRLFYR